MKDKNNPAWNMRLLLLVIVGGIFLSLAASAETILMIGDSHTNGAYGNKLKSLLESSGDNYVIKEAVDGSHIPDWINGNPQLQTLITTNNPDTVIISLGTNDFDNRNTERNARNLLRVIPSDKRCFWVGPPAVRETPPPSGGITNTAVDNMLYPAITAAIGTCTLIDSRLFTDKNNPNSYEPNGYHLSPNAGRDWATGVYNQYNRIAGQTTPAIARRGGAAASTIGSPSSPQSSSTSSTSLCNNQQQCREIDEVWQRRLGFFIRSPNEVWDVAASRWQDFNVVYPTTTRTSTETFVSGERPTGVCVASVGTSEQKALLDTIAWAEGTSNMGDNGYNVVVNGEFVRYRDQQSTGRYYRENNHNFFQGYQSHPDILIRFRRDGGECTDNKDSPCSTAAGRYGFLTGTYNDLKNSGFFNDFGPAEQDRAALRLILDNRVTQQTITDAISNNNFVLVWDSLAKVWASLPKSNGQGAYNQPVQKIQQLQQQFEKCLQEQQSRAS